MIVLTTFAGVREFLQATFIVANLDPLRAPPILPVTARSLSEN